MIFFLLVGCQAQTKDEDKQFSEYKKIKTNLIQQTHFDDEFPFSIQVVYNELDDGYRYDVVINQVQEDIYDLNVVAYTDESDEQMCPTIGLFDEEQYNLKVDFVDKANGFYKGVRISGTTTQIQNVKVYVQYYTDESLKNSVEKYIEVKNETR